MTDLQLLMQIKDLLILLEQYLLLGSTDGKPERQNLRKEMKRMLEGIKKIP